MLRWLVDAQSLPELMWALVLQSFAMVAVVGYLLLERTLLPRPIGERLAHRVLELGVELGPLTGILGSVCGFAIALGHVGGDDQAEVFAALKTAMYCTGAGLALAIVQTIVVQMFPWRFQR